MACTEGSRQLILWLVRSMTPPQKRTFNPRGLVLIAIAVVLIGLSIAIRVQSAPPGVARSWPPTAAELKLLVGFVAVVFLFAVAAILGVWCAHVRVRSRLRKLANRQNEITVATKT